MSDRFDARAYWDGLSAEDQRQFGALAMLFLVAGDAVHGSRWDHAFEEAEKRIAELVPKAAHYPGGPDLAALGIRACRQCGCTDESACEDGCHWVGPDLCSRCAPEAAKPEPADTEPLGEPQPAAVAEFDCAECGRHIHHFGPSPGSPPRCATCINMPGWFRTPELRRAIDNDPDWVPPE
jgi:hypothetical protein